jgi:alpha-glucosidase
VVNRPNSTTTSTAAEASLQFVLVEDPFSFAIQRKGSKETIFNTSGSQLIFESQYLRLRTSLPVNPNLYGFGEDADPFRLNTTNYVRTLWSSGEPFLPTGTNLYGSHPIYFDHRETNNETHGVFLLNSNGMDLKINNTIETGQYLEYNTLGGIIDLYFLAGPSPIEVSQQYSQIIGVPAMMPYWGFGFHQCRYGMQDVWEVADVVFNYSAADIPLETMWTDIDYMDLRKIFTVDPARFPLEKMRGLVTYLHDHDQQYIMMVDPAVAYQEYPPFTNGVEAGVFMEDGSNGDVYKGTWRNNS